MIFDELSNAVFIIRYLNSVRRYKAAASTAPPIHVFLDQKMTFLGKTHLFICFLESKLIELRWPLVENANFVSQKVNLGHGKKVKSLPN